MKTTTWKKCAWLYSHKLTWMGSGYHLHLLLLDMQWFQCFHITIGNALIIWIMVYNIEYYKHWNIIGHICIYIYVYIYIYISLLGPAPAYPAKMKAVVWLDDAQRFLTYALLEYGLIDQGELDMIYMKPRGGLCGSKSHVLVRHCLANVNEIEIR